MEKSNRLSALESNSLSISCIVPVCNEADLIADFISKISQQLASLTNNFELILIDDGSQDQSVMKIKALMPSMPQLKLLVFSRNFGKEQAITAGLKAAKADVTIIIDADFQHPTDIIPDFLKHWAQGYDMVYGVRNNRNHDGLLKKTLTSAFYRLMNLIADINIPADAGDFRLLDRKVVTALNALREKNRYMKGLYAWVGYQSIGIPFDVSERRNGHSGWSFKKLFNLAITGITSFSDIPLRTWTVIGLTISCISLFYAFWIVMKTLVYGADTPGFATLIVAITFIGGIQIFSIGIIGEYIASIFNEVKQRPQYLIDEKLGFDND